MLGRWPVVATLLGSGVAHEIIAMGLSLFLYLSAPPHLPWGIGPELARNLFQRVLEKPHRSEFCVAHNLADSNLWTLQIDWELFSHLR